MVNLSLKTVLLRSTMLVGATAFAFPAFAQVTPGTPAAGNATTGATAEAAPNPEGEREITVTGSLIKNPNLVRATPVIVTTAEEIELKQSNTAEDVLREIPGVVPSIGSAVNNGNGGASFVDLRGLGSNRNIVLLDGARIVPAGLVGRVDLNNIPLALVDRVETLTGGASTTYGADAVSGVVNFITKQNFTGVDLSASNQITEKGDGQYYRADLTIGGNFADDKGNAVLSVGYQHADPVYQGDRSFSNVNLGSFSGAAGGSGTYVPTGFTGTRNIDPTTGQPSIIPGFSGYGADGTPIVNALGTNNPAKRQINPTTGQAVATYAPFNYNPYNIFQTPFKRFNIFAQAKYDVSDNFTVYTRGLFSKNTIQTIIAPSGSFGTSVVIPLSNPYLPAALRNQFCARNIAPVTPNPVAGGASVQTTYVPFLTPAQCTAAAAATSPTDPNYKTVTTTISRRTTEVGPRISEYTTTVFDYKVGARGKFGDHLDWDVNAAYGESENLQVIQNYTLASRTRQALLATNTASCLDTSNGCVPVNIFGANGSITPAQAAFLTAASTTRVKTQLGQVHAQLSGDFGFASPAATDPISFAVGAEYRNYKAIQASDTLAKTAGELGGAGGAAPDINGGYNVKEGFGELVVPLVQDKPGIQSLTASGGIRYSSYSVNAATNPSYNTTTYKGELAYEPGFGLKLRGNYSRAVRAPNIAELFNPITTGLTNLSVDPCAGTAPLTNALLRSVCLAQGAPVGTIGNINNPTAGQANQTGGGNINIRPEVSDSYGGGVVFAPKFVSGLSFSVDYYNIVINHAITTPVPGDVIAGCFGSLTAASATSASCLGIRRNPVTGALDGDPATTPGLPLPETNNGRIRTDGIDLTANYSRDIGFAKLGLSLSGNYTFHSKFQANAFTTALFPLRSLDRECVGYYSVNCTFTGSLQPQWQTTQRTTLSFDSFDISLLWRHLDKLNQEPDDIANGNGPAFSGVDGTGATVNYGHIKPYDYFDLSTRISVLENLSLTLTVQNIGNRKPPSVGTGIGSSTYNSGNTYPSTYDALGRRYAASVRVKF
ncbi:TonB-dependent receptor domain-containing protein [Glacieibacterium megasporae]|uniref:TonB-dependent receptor domain-containing protein n=1 Tax=Glacieibacterium megasporae TaxID=2835787 RepID=UPI001C1E2ED5|nr:TonB-dependent receptor [Polymorphobacter megasporae]UAJ10350.1 TonB-dependent receptor [Polymorphobacter megasporae]